MSGPIVIWGAGAIGGTLGAALVRAGEDVLFVDRAADHIATLNRAGLTITGPVDAYCVPARALTPDEVVGSYERILLCVKAHDTPGAAELLRPHLAPGGHVVSVQNGLNERVIADVVGRERTVGCFVNFGADYIEPGIVHFGGRGAVVVGELDGEYTARIQEVHRLFRLFDEGAMLTDNIWGYLWSKLVYGAQLFATALTDEAIADVFAAPRCRRLLTRLAHEVVAVALAEGVRLEAFDGFDPRAFLPGASERETERSFDEMAAHNRRSAKTHSGIWRDLTVRKRKTEVDAQLGAIVEIGARHGIPTPITAAIMAFIHEIEAGRRMLTSANLDALEGLPSASVPMGRGRRSRIAAARRPG